MSRRNSRSDTDEDGVRRVNSKGLGDAYRPASSAGLGSAALTLGAACDRELEQFDVSSTSPKGVQLPTKEEAPSADGGGEWRVLDSAGSMGGNWRVLDSAGTMGTVGSTNMGLSSEGEIEIAELETRIRRFNLDLMQPTIRKTSQLEQDMRELRAELRRSTSRITDLASVAIKVEEQVVVVEGFREEMSKFEFERKAVQTHVAENVASMRLDLDKFRYDLERKDTSIHSTQRTMDRLVGELSRLQEGSEGLRQHIELRLGQTGKVLNGAKTDLESKLIALETKHNRLSDELWGEETGLAKATSNITKTNDLVMSLSEELKRMQHDKANVTQLEAVQEDVNDLIRDCNGNVTMLKQTVDTMVNDVKAHFKTATNTVAAHNATMLSEVRASYQEELSHAAALRSEVMQFMHETRDGISNIKNTVESSDLATSDMVLKVATEVEDLHKNRKRDNSENTVAGQTMREQVSKVSSSSETVAKCLEHLSSVMTILLKSERVDSALSQQENIDRTKVALMGYRDAKGAKAHPTSTKMAKTPRKNSSPADGEGGNGEAVISVDNRCLSCSGQAQHVLSGFKMACLQYAPGPVFFSKKLYKREELLDLRQKLLEQAQEQLQHGPAGNLGDFTNQRSNLHRELEASMKRAVSEETPERPSSQNSENPTGRQQALPPIRGTNMTPPPGSSSHDSEAGRPMTSR